MAQLHTWAGLLPGWLLFLIVLFGTAIFFRQEINQWMRPELRAAPISNRALDAAGAYPMVAPSYTEQRSTLAKTIGLGHKPETKASVARPSPEAVKPAKAAHIRRARKKAAETPQPE
ncbi:PepSY-associated TM helix domain-containing protein [Sphingobium cloacae]|uniref:Uncharacterized protein n=1 Tax=Sphingobium cloacae TaxID=120107 RepID=A0A1E1EXY5_9SPHN|nr:PepSY-associated TM helix domain-containing protein [Sphingobium cloacae]BAV63091.1 hypothetical protein SCLO_1000510 [Sphingobium cloacae]